jgi:acyl-coenzyme A thioesterase PaaI-like protein
VATILDEISCAAVNLVTDRWVATGELTVRYERPCPVEEPLDAVAAITDRTHPRYWIVEAELHRAGERVARSSGKFFLRAAEPIAP